MPPLGLTAKLARAAAVVAGSLRPDADGRWLVEAEIRLARKSTRLAAPVMVIGAFATAQSCADWIAADVRYAWSTAIALLAVTLHVVTRRIDSRPLATLAEVRRRAAWQAFATLLFLSAWCSMSVFLWAPGSAYNHLFIALILAASLAGSTALGSAHPATALVVVLCHGVFLVVPFALSALPLDHTLAWLSVAYAIMMAEQTAVMHRSQEKMLRLEHERSGLVEGLRLAKLESDRERARAATAGRAKSQFLSNMNHELRTPMNAILGFSELIKHKAFADDIDKYAEYAGIIHQSGQNLLRLIDDVLDLAKIENGKLGLRESEFSFVQLLGELFDEFEPKAAAAQLSLLKKVPPGLPRVHADERALRQILVNLISNAIKFTPAGGCVTLFAGRGDDGRLAFGVDDTGIGIAEEDQARVFERFGQGRHDVATADKGTGLGLAIVKGFAEAHDGEVELKSALGAGTRVTVHLPAERLRAAALRKSA